MNLRFHQKASPAVILALALVMGAHAAAAQDPAAPPGTDPGGPAIALISTGVDYTDPMIARRLARDGEGEPIAWDFVENDLRPHGPSDPETSSGTKLAKLILSLNEKARLINVRVSRAEPDQLAKAAMFVARTPARVAVVGTFPEETAGWEQFGGAAQQAAAHVLFVVPGGTPSQDVGGVPYPLQLNLANAIATVPLTGAADGMPMDALIKPREIKIGEQTAVVPTNSLEAAALLGGYAVCVVDAKDVEDAAAARALLQTRAIENDSAKNVYDPVCTANSGGGHAPTARKPSANGETR